MRPRKPGTKTGNSAARGSSLDEHHGNLKTPKKPQKCFCYTSNILMMGREFSPKNTGLFKLWLYSFAFVCVTGWGFVLVSTNFSTSHIYRLDESWALNSNAGLCSQRKKVMDSGLDFGNNTPLKMKKIPSHQTLTPHLRISLIEKGIGHFSTLAGGNLLM